MKKISRFLWRVAWTLLAVHFFLLAFGTGIIDILSPAHELSYVETVQFITEERVESIKLYSNDTEAEIRLKNDANRYVTNIPNENVFCEFVQESISDGNTLEITKSKKDGIWLKIFYFILGLFFSATAFSKESKRKGTSANISHTNMEPDLESKVETKENLNAQTDTKQKSEEQKVYFSDVAGLEEEKEELMEIVDFLKNPDKYARIGAKIPKGILLSGAPGTGKTLLAKAVAGEAKVPFVHVSGSEFDEMYVGVGASRVRALFETAKKHSPCIIFIDEIDAVGQARNRMNISSNNQTIQQLLTELDGFDTDSSVIVLAATNRPDSLDPALTRPGRFDRNIQVRLPDVQGREEILKIHGRNKKFMDDVSFSAIAHNTAGFSGAELKNLLNEAAIITVRKREEIISQASIDEALKKISIGLQKKGRKISEKERRLVAYHEAGHAIVSSFMATQANVKEVSIIPRGGAGGYTWHETVEDKSYISKTELTERLVTLLGGRAAEQVALKDISTGASNDLKVATSIAQNMICVYGMNPEVGPISLVSTNNQLLGAETTSLIGKLITQTVKEAEQKAIKILSDNRYLLERVANALLAKETITGAELSEILKRYKNNSL